MGKINFDIQEENFVKKYTDSYDLSILIGVDRFSFLISDPQQNILLLRSYVYDKPSESFGEIGDSIKDIYINDEILKYDYKQVKIGVVNSKFTFVPTELFDWQQKALYLKNIVPIPTKDDILVDQLKPMGMVNVFSANREVISQLQGYFPTAQIRHLSSALIAAYRKIAERQTGRHIYLNVRQGVMQLSVFDNKEMLFHNSFVYRTSKDFIYYVMLIFDQFKLSQEDDPVHISGLIVEESEIYQLLYRYILDLRMMDYPAQFKPGTHANRLSSHQYFDLYSLNTCE